MSQACKHLIPNMNWGRGTNLPHIYIKCHKREELCVWFYWAEKIKNQLNIVQGCYVGADSPFACVALYVILPSMCVCMYKWMYIHW